MTKMRPDPVVRPFGAQVVEQQQLGVLDRVHPLVYVAPGSLYAPRMLSSSSGTVTKSAGTRFLSR